MRGVPVLAAFVRRDDSPGALHGEYHRAREDGCVCRRYDNGQLRQAGRDYRAGLFPGRQADMVRCHSALDKCGDSTVLPYLLHHAL